MENMSEKEWLKFYREYLYWTVDIKDEHDPPDYREAADVILRWLQEYCTHPIRFYSYQLDSLSYFVRNLHAKAGGGLIPFEAFQQFCLELYRLCNEGQLPDTREKDN